VTTPVLICDDSSFARKQVARALPSDWPVAINFAGSGEEALAAVRAGQGDVLFLDLNMPGLDGYQVLETIRAQDLPTLVIVISGDIQPEARARVRALGALEFMQKPLDDAALREVLARYGIHQSATHKVRNVDLAVDLLDGYREVANVAMGRAADRLARLLQAFVVMPVPRVAMLEGSELRMALGQFGHGEPAWGVCQGFIGAGVAGEALLVFRESSFEDLAALMKFEDQIDETARIELVMDMSNVLIGACLQGLAEQLDISLVQGYPMVLGRHVKVEELLRRNAARCKRTLAIEMGCAIEKRQVRCELLLLFSEDSLAALDQRIGVLVE
jgi:CheY-like chemotaxis protein